MERHDDWFDDELPDDYDDDAPDDAMPWYDLPVELDEEPGEDGAATFPVWPLWTYRQRWGVTEDPEALAN